MLRLPRLQHMAMWLRMPEAVVQRVDLDHVGAEVGQQLGAERAGDGQAEVEHHDAVERRRRSERPVGGDGLARPICCGRRLGQHLVGVLADAAPGRADLRRRGRQPVDLTRPGGAAPARGRRPR